MAVVIFTRLIAKAGRREEVLAVLDELGVSTRAEPGCSAFASYAARDEADVVLGYEVFDDDEAVAAHRSRDAVAVARERLDDLLAEAPHIDYALG